MSGKKEKKESKAGQSNQVAAVGEPVQLQFSMEAINKAVIEAVGKEFISNFRGGKVDWPCFPYGLNELDQLLVIGGAARGRLTEIFGPQHVGKTSLAMHLAMRVQSYGIPVIWQDYEQATDFNYAQRIGMSFHPDFMQFSQPESAEEGFTAIEIALENGFPGLIVIDSIPACIPKAVLEAKIDDTARPGYEAFIYTKCIEKILTPLRKSWACFVGLNQMRASIGTNITKYTPEEKRYNTPGGNAWKHYATVRLQLKMKHGEAWEAKQGVSVIKVKSVKNKLGFPYKECEIQLVPGVGFVG